MTGVVQVKTQRDMAFYRGEEIPENADLNTYTTPGIYYSPSRTRTPTISNIPSGVDSNFRLEVLYAGSTDSYYRVQKLKTTVGGDYEYVRVRNGSSWGAWKKILTEADLGDLGTGAVNVHRFTVLPSSGNNTYALSIPEKNKHGFLFLTSVSTNPTTATGIYSIWTDSSTGVGNLKALIEGTNISFSYSANSITITNSSGWYVYGLVILF